MSMFDRVKEVSKKRGLSLAQLNEKANFKPNVIYSWKTKTPSIDKVESVAKVLGVSVDYLLDRNKDPIPSNLEPVNSKDLVNIPVIGTIKAGLNGIAFEEEIGAEFTSVSDIDMSFDYFWLKVRGDSMTGDGISEGDYALIKKTTEFNKNDICAVIVDGEEGTLKHVTQNEDSIVLTASNPIYPPRVFTGTDMNKILIAGKLVQIKRNY